MAGRLDAWLIAGLCVLAAGCRGELVESDAAVCGDGFVGEGEECEGVPPPVGCSAETCRVEPGYACSEVGGETGTGGAEQFECMLLPSCGDGVVDTGEQCDDRNAVALDGCSGCVLEVGWQCLGSPSNCAAICSDGRWLDQSLAPGQPEACDDGNDQPMDGCSPSCEIEPGCTCTGEVGGQTQCECPDVTTTTAMPGTDTDTETDTGTGTGTDAGTGTDTETESSSGSSSTTL